MREVSSHCIHGEWFRFWDEQAFRKEIAFVIRPISWYDYGFTAADTQQGILIRHRPAGSLAASRCPMLAQELTLLRTMGHATNLVTLIVYSKNVRTVLQTLFQSKIFIWFPVEVSLEEKLLLRDTDI